MSDRMTKKRARANDGFDGFIAENDDGTMSLTNSLASSWGAVIGGTLGLVGGIASSKASKGAAETQAAAGAQAAAAQLQATREANQLAASMYRQGMANQAPFQQGGQVALSALMAGMGLGPAKNRGLTSGGVQAGPVAPTGDVGVPTFTNAEGQIVDAQGVPVGAPEQGAANFGIGDLNYGASQDELDAAGQPYAGRFTEKFTGQDIYTDPSYAFRTEEGLRAIRAAQGAAGNRFSGQALKDITNYGQQAGSQEYAAANQRFLTNQGLAYDRLAALAGIGQNAANTASSAGTAAGSQIGQNTIAGQNVANQYLTSGAASSAAGRVGSTNALVSGINSGLNNYLMLSQMGGRKTGGQGYGALYDINPDGDMN